MEELGVCFIGMGVSKEYQSARRAASLSPNADKVVLDHMILPFLQTISAEADKGGECLTNIGPGGSSLDLIQSLGPSEESFLRSTPSSGRRSWPSSATKTIPNLFRQIDLPEHALYSMKPSGFAVSLA